MVGRHPARLATGLAGERCQAAPAVQALGAAGIAGGASGGCGQVVLLLFLVCILGSTLLATVILRGEGEGRLRAEGPPLSGTGPCAPAALRTLCQTPWWC